MDALDRDGQPCIRSDWGHVNGGRSGRLGLSLPLGHLPSSVARALPPCWSRGAMWVRFAAKDAPPSLPAFDGASELKRCVLPRAWADARFRGTGGSLVHIVVHAVDNLEVDHF